MSAFVIEATLPVPGLADAGFSVWYTGKGWSEERPNAKEFRFYSLALLQMNKIAAPFGAIACEVVDESDED